MSTQDGDSLSLLIEVTVSQESVDDKLSLT